MIYFYSLFNALTTSQHVFLKSVLTLRLHCRVLWMKILLFRRDLRLLFFNLCFYSDCIFMAWSPYPALYEWKHTSVWHSKIVCHCKINTTETSLCNRELLITSSKLNGKWKYSYSRFTFILGHYMACILEVFASYLSLMLWKINATL